MPDPLDTYDTMQFIRHVVTTFCRGQAASMAAILRAACTKGKRFALPNTRLIIHQPLGGFSGQASDIDIHAREMLRIKHRLSEIIVTHTGQPEERVAHDSDRDFIMTSEAAKEYGLIDQVIEKRN